MDFVSIIEVLGVLAVVGAIVESMQDSQAKRRAEEHRKRMEDSADRAAMAAERQMALLTGIALQGAARATEDDRQRWPANKPWDAGQRHGSVPTAVPRRMGRD